MTDTRATTTRTTTRKRAPIRVENNDGDSFNLSDGGIPDIEMPDMPKSKAETELILKSLAKSYALIAQFVMLVSIEDAALIARNIDDMVESWRQLLDDDPKLRKTMLKLVKSSGWGTVITAHLAVALPIAANHRDSFAHLIKPKSAPVETFDTN